MTAIRFLFILLLAHPFAASAQLLNEDAWDVVHYDITAAPSVDGDPHLQGTTRIRFRALAPLSEFELQLDSALHLISFEGFTHPVRKGSDRIHIRLAQPLATGESGEISLTYAGTPTVLNGMKGLRFEKHGPENAPVIVSLCTPFLAHLWFACKDGPADKADSVDVHIRVPKKSFQGHALTGISIGTNEGVTDEGSTLLCHWKHRDPVVPYYIMMAVSNYRSIESPYTDPFGNSFPLIHYCFPETYAESLQGVARLPEVMDFFSNTFGPYPFLQEKYGMTEMGFYSGIEKQTNAVVNNLGIGDFETMVHELAHMWYADMITCKDWHHGWLNEGFATYAEALWAEHDKGRAGYFAKMQDTKTLEESSVYLNDISDPFGIFVSQVYYKGAWILHMLRCKMGDEAFFAALKSYTANPEFRFKHVVTDDWQRICQQHTKENLDRFFEEWVKGVGLPVYVLEVNETNKNKVILHQVQEEILGWPLYQSAVGLFWKDSESEHTGHSISFGRAAAVTEVELNNYTPGSLVLVDPMENLLCLSITVTDYEKWNAGGQMIPTVSTYAPKGETLIMFNPTKSQNCTVTVTTGEGVETKIFSGKRGPDDEPIEWAGPQDENAQRRGFEDVLLKIQMKGYEMYTSFRWVKVSNP